MTKIIKISGEPQEFSDHKLYLNLQKIGLTDFQIEQITAKISPPTSTKQLRANVAAIMTEVLPSEEAILMKARYLLKEAIYALGPDGFYFEQLVGRLFENQDFETEVGTMQKGKCVEHEVDVYAHKPGEYHFVECKFHNKEGTRSDLVDVLYTNARFDDLHDAHIADEPHADFGWLATNTKLTHTALKYSECQGLKILSLTKPEGTSITDQIFTKGLYPVTSLESIKDVHRQLLADGYITIQDLSEAIAANRSPLDQEKTLLAQTEIATLQG